MNCTSCAANFLRAPSSALRYLFSGVRVEQRHRISASYFFTFGGAQEPRHRVPHVWSGCWLRQPDLCGKLSSSSVGCGAFFLGRNPGVGLSTSTCGQMAEKDGTQKCALCFQGLLLTHPIEGYGVSPLRTLIPTTCNRYAVLKRWRKSPELTALFEICEFRRSGDRTGLFRGGSRFNRRRSSQHRKTARVLPTRPRAQPRDEVVE